MFGFDDIAKALAKLAVFEQLITQLLSTVNALGGEIRELRADNVQFKDDNAKLLAALDKPSTEA